MELGVYRHYKGAHYQVLCVARHSETDELMVVYVSLEGAHMPGPRVSVRPLRGPEGFLTATDSGWPRFAYVGYEIPRPQETPVHPEPSRRFVLEDGRIFELEEFVGECPPIGPENFADLPAKVGDCVNFPKFGDNSYVGHAYYKRVK